MTSFVTGASGFIGLNIVESLLNQGEKVVLFSRRSIIPNKNNFFLPPAYEFFSRLPGEMHVETGSITDQKLLETLIKKYRPDFIIHGAAITPGTTREKEQMKLTAEVNFMGTLAILEAARKHPPKRFVHLSSGSVYGLNSFAANELEEKKVLPIPDGIYSITKHAAERLALRYKAIYDMDVVVARLGTVFGPWEWDTGIRASLSTILQITECAFNGIPAIMPNVEGKKDWIYSRDITEAINALMKTTLLPHEIYNVGPGKMWALDDWCKKLANHFSDFKWIKSDNLQDVNCSYGTADRAPFSIHLLEKDTGFRARYELDQAFEDYMEWIKYVRFFERGK